jgi:hypothetical protein
MILNKQIGNPNQDYTISLGSGIEKKKVWKCLLILTASADGF